MKRKLFNFSNRDRNAALLWLSVAAILLDAMTIIAVLAAAVAERRGG